MSLAWKIFIFIIAGAVTVTIGAIPYLYDQNRQRSAEIERVLDQNPCTRVPLDRKACIKQSEKGLHEHLLTKDLACAIVEAAGVSSRLCSTHKAHQRSHASPGSAAEAPSGAAQRNPSRGQNTKPSPKPQNKPPSPGPGTTTVTTPAPPQCEANLLGNCVKLPHLDVPQPIGGPN